MRFVKYLNRCFLAAIGQNMQQRHDQKRLIQRSQKEKPCPMDISGRQFKSMNDIHVGHGEVSSINCFFLVIVVFVCGLSSCKKFVEIPPPTTQVASVSVFNNSTTATSAEISIYTQMANNGESYFLALYSGLLADELKNYSASTIMEDYYTNAMNAGGANTFGHWSSYYSYIYQANAIISSLQGNSNIVPAIEQQLIGEAEFVRAFWLFYLANCYGDVPIVTTPNYVVNSSIARSPETQVYRQIISDLSDAEQKLNGNYIDVSDTAVTTERTRPNKAVAEALLSRVYLYMGKYDSSKMLATDLINNSIYQLCANLSPVMGANSVFLANSAEAIWQLAIPLPTSSDTRDAFYFILTGAPSTSQGATTKCTTISEQLLNTFEAGDLRRKYWIDSTTLTTPHYYYPFKYESNSSSAPEYVMVLRLAEQYLIRAESEAQLGDSTDAITDLNVIRNRAGLADYSQAVQGPLLQAILHERQMELFTEWGHRWFDLLRTGAVDTVLGAPGNVYNAKGGVGTWNAEWELYPIWPSQISVDPNLTQNPGY